MLNWIKSLFKPIVAPNEPFYLVEGVHVCLLTDEAANDQAPMKHNIYAGQTFSMDGVKHIIVSNDGLGFWVKRV